MRHLTQSMLKTYTWCQKKFYFSYVALLKPTAYHFPFSIGAAIDDGLGSLLKFRNVDTAIQTAKDTLYSRRKEFEQYGSFSLKAEQEFQYQVVCSEAMIQAYAVYNKRFIDSIQIIIVQEVVMKKIPGIPIPLAGKVDAIIKYKGNKHLYELKTTKQIDVNYIQQYYPQLYHYSMLVDGINSHVILDLVGKPTIRQTAYEDSQEFIDRLFQQYMTSSDKFKIQFVKIKKRYLKQYTEFVKKAAYDILESVEKEQFVCDKFMCMVYSKCEFYSLCNYGFNPLTKRKYTEKISLSEELLK